MKKINTNVNRSEAEEILRQLRPIDDNFFREIFRNDIPLTEFVLRLFLDKPDLIVTEQETQYDLKRLLGARSICLDVKATDSLGTRYNIEAQKDEDGASPHRARYHLSSLDVEHLNAGQDFKELPETIVIFVTETDVFGKNKPIYHIERINLDADEPFNDGEHIVYINASYKDESTPLGRLLHDFLCNDPNEMKTPEMAERTRYFKEREEGVSYMCKLLDDYSEKKANKRADERAFEIALNLLKASQTLTFVANMTQLPFDVVKQLAIDNGIAYTV